MDGPVQIQELEFLSNRQHQFLFTLAKQIEQCQTDNAALRAELASLKVAQRLDTLEQSIQDLADMQRTSTPYAQQVHMGPQDEGAGAALSALAAMVAGSTPGSAAPGAADGAAAGLAGFPGAQLRYPTPSGSGVPGMPGAPGSAGMPGAPGMAGAAGTQGLPGAPGSPPTYILGAGTGQQDNSWILFEFNTVKERIQQMERKAEALWHSQENDQELRSVVDRLKHDVEALQAKLAEAQGASRASNSTLEKLDASNRMLRERLTECSDKIVFLEAQAQKASEERRDSTVRAETNVNQIWDQIRHVENALSQRLTLAETGQVGMLQEVDDTKEVANDVLNRVEETRRHITALESKLESFNTQVAAAISPLHTSLQHVNGKLDDVMKKKLDATSAVTLDDVNVAVSRAVDHADRRADNIIKSIGAMEGRVEELNDTKANKSDVVMTTDLEALLTAHASEMDRHLEALKMEIIHMVSVKADKDELVALDAKLGQRVGALEGAILKGLKAISDKVSAALSEKLDITRFNEFKVQVRAILADVEDRLRDWSPAARGMKATMGLDGGLGASSCLCCDSRVRNVKELQSMGFTSNDKVFSPERLPNIEGMLPAITRSPDMGAHTNAKVAARKREAAAGAAALSRSMGNLTESLPPVPIAAQTPPPGQILLAPSQAMLPDPASLLSLTTAQQSRASPLGGTSKGGANNKVEVETISGAIAEGRIPNMRGKELKNPNLPRDPSGGWDHSPGRPQSGMRGSGGGGADPQLSVAGKGPQPQAPAAEVAGA